MLLLLVGCIPSPDVYTPGEAPATAILSPGPGSTLDAGYAELRGRVSDETHGPEHIYVAWDAGVEGADDAGGWTELCAGLAQADGTTLCAAELTPATRHLRLRATDLAGYVGVDVVDVEVVERHAPEITLVAPIGGHEHEGSPVRVVLRVADADDPVVDVDVVATIDGVVQPLPRRPDADGLVAGDLSLDRGTWALDVLATDPRGLATSARFGLAVLPPNAAPTVSATALVVPPGAPVVLSGSAVDDVTAPGDLRVTVSEGGVALFDGVGAPDGWLSLPLPPLSVGVHGVTVAAVDEEGAVGEAMTTVTVDTPPEVTWTTPVAEAVFPRGASVALVLDAVDVLTPATSLVVTLTSNVDGPRASVAPDEHGHVDVRFSLSPGAHTLTLDVVDAQGLRARAIRDVTVE